VRTKANKQNSLIPVAAFAAVVFLIAGCGGKSLDKVVAPTSGETGATQFVSESPDDMQAFSAIQIGNDAVAVTTFGGGASISTSGAAFLDMSTCENCHQSQYQGFLETNHNLAWEKKAVQIRPEYGKSYFAQMASAGKKYCVQCHTVTAPFLDLNENHTFEPASGEVAPFGLSPSQTAGTWGGVLNTATFTDYTQVPTEFKGIQCENCHGPASLHVGGNGDENYIVVKEQAWRASTCSYCHGQYNEWKKSMHSMAISTDATANPAEHVLANVQGASGSCAGCHSGDGFIEAMEATNVEPKDFNATGGYSGAGKGTAGYYGKVGITCAVCHDPHSKSNGEHQLRAPKDEFCGKCHNSRYRKYVSGGQTKYDKYPGQGRGPHQPQKEMWDGGTGGNGGVQISTASNAISTWGFSTGTTTLKWAFVSGSKFMGETNCVDCHMYSYTDRTKGIEWLGHTFNPRTEACQTCHSGMDASSLIGNIQARFTKKYDSLSARLDNFITANMAAPDTTNCSEPASGYCCNGMPSGEARERCAVVEYNLKFLNADKSEGVHNEDYANKLFDICDSTLKELGY
jgi:predicted CXXCH cytochrome family protein